MKFIMTLLFASLLIPSSEISITEFISKLENEILDYTEVRSIDKIPRSVFKSINKWKYQNLNSKKDLNSKFESKMFKFKLADVDKPYNSGCLVSSKLPQRQLIFAANKDSEWVIVYKHGMGVAGPQTRMLHINTKEPEKISLFIMDRVVENNEELKNYLDILKELDSNSMSNNLILFLGNTILKNQNSKDLAYKV